MSALDEVAVEAAARAICGQDLITPFDELKPSVQAKYRRQAGEALRAVRFDWLVPVARRGLEDLRNELACVLEGCCTLGDDLQPILDTLEPEQAPYVAELEAAIAAACAALGDQVTA